MNLHQLIENILDESGYRKNPYFVALKDGTFDRKDFVETQIQFFWAVSFFSRPMAALAGKIPTPELRMEIVRNVWEEHGEGALNKIHRSTFLEFLKRIDNVGEKEIVQRALWPELRTFNTLLSGVCVMDEYLTGVGLMGMIERMFADISAWIGIGIVERGWLTQENMVHYSLHQELDVKHSQDFFDILEKSWARSPEDQYAIEQGLRLGAYNFNGLYEGLYRARERRVMRKVFGHHSRAEG